jgi:predicted phage baseplate assembly protein
VRNADGSLTQYGAVPEKGSIVEVPEYRTGGGQQGNVATGALRVNRQTIAFVSRVENRKAATGGVDGESVEEAMVRGPIVLRTLGRAVTAEDYEQLARQAAPEAARVKALAASGADDAGGVRVVVVPAVADDEDGRLRFEQLDPDPHMLATIADALDAKRTIGARVIVEPPDYQGVTVVATIRARPWADRTRLARTATDALFDYLHPIRGGRDGNGWPFGRAVLLGDIFAQLQGLPGVELVEDVRLFARNLSALDERGEESRRVEVAPNALIFSYQHQVQVVGPA